MRFGDAATEDLFNGIDSKRARNRLPKDLWAPARRKLVVVVAASSLQDLASPPSNNLEKLKGDMAGRWSIRINRQYRIVFRFDDVASDIVVIDYH